MRPPSRARSASRRPSSRRARVAALLGLGLIARGPAGCVTARSAHRCPESVVARCLTAVVCEVDRRRSCEVCRCSDAPYVPIQR